MCPECNHEWKVHDHEEGCYQGWKYVDDGKHLHLQSSGCECRLSHANDSPKSIDIRGVVSNE